MIRKIPIRVTQTVPVALNIKRRPFLKIVGKKDGFYLETVSEMPVIDLSQKRDNFMTMT